MWGVWPWIRSDIHGKEDGCLKWARRSCWVCHEVFIVAVVESFIYKVACQSGYACFDSVKADRRKMVLQDAAEGLEHFSDL
jgi:hypothetical protein